ncbi:MAG: sigma-54-dependent Fis family transcriptional regulator [Rhodocyclaceae bacterium]|nr:sigma-54-dependent Fis family transcriptional regulator [Rhodocyclaceae bacterium]
MTTLLVVDDEIGIRELLSEILTDEGYDVKLAENASRARNIRNAGRPDLVLLDIWMPDTDGITLLKEWASNGQLTMPVIMMSGHGTIDSAVEATRIGALDFLEKPIALQKLLSTIKRGLQHGHATATGHLTLAAFTRSAPLRDLARRLNQVCAASRHVLLRSAKGGIAELCARSVQGAGKPWYDFAAQSAPLGVDQLEQLRGGILLAAELGALTRPQQKNLGFAIDRLERYDLRLLAGSAEGSEALLAAGWDETLVRNLFTVTLATPNLAELRDDVPDIAARVLTHLVESGAVQPRRLSSAAQNALRNYSWPGGYPELVSSLRSLALAALQDEIGEDDVKRLLSPQIAKSLSLPLDQPLREAREAFERLYFEYHLQLEHGNMTRLAEKSGMERTHLYRKLKQLGLQTSRRGDPD